MVGVSWSSPGSVVVGRYYELLKEKENLLSGNPNTYKYRCSMEQLNQEIEIIKKKIDDNNYPTKCPTVYTR